MKTTITFQDKNVVAQKVSVVTINYNQSVTTNELLDSLQQVNWTDLEIIVVDNNSEMEDYKNINTSYKNVLIMRSLKNLGFAGGNNLGARAASGNFILFLNNDTIVPANLIEVLVARLMQNAQIGAVSPKIKYHQNPRLIQYAGYSQMSPITLRMRAYGHKEVDSEAFDEASETPFIHGCAVMVRSEILERAGYMPENYFLYYEELDWSIRIKQAGFILWYEPDTFVLHKESVSVKKNSPLKIYYITRNRLLFIRRNLKGAHRVLSLIYTLLIASSKHSVQYIIHKNWAMLTAYWRGTFWHLSN